MSIDNRKIYPVIYVKTPFTVNKQGVVYWTPVFYDYKCQLIKPFTLYALYCAEKRLLGEKITTDAVSQGYKTKLNHIAGALHVLATFLAVKRVDIADFDDEAMMEFRSWDLKRILAKKQNTTEDIAARTVNIKLRIIYRFYLWAQEYANFVENHISWNPPYKIRSKLKEFKDHPKLFTKSVQKKKQIFPLCYEEISRCAAHRQHFATSEQVERLKAWWRQECSPLVAERNIMIVDCIDYYGWRRSTIASLCVADFINEIYPEDFVGNIEVQPAKQKYNQGHITQIKAQFLIRIRQYIDNVRTKMLKNGTDSFDALFVAATTGAPLQAETITQIISDGFRAIGLKYRRMGPHSIRRKKGMDQTSDVIAGRTRDGSSVNPEDVVQEVAVSLQQNSTSATHFYSKGIQEYRANQPEAKLRDVVVEKDALISRLEIEKARLLARNRHHKLAEERMAARIRELEMKQEEQP